MARLKKKSSNSSGEKNKSFDLDSFLEKESLNTTNQEKEKSWIPMPKAWHDALKIPGFPRGYVSLIRGYSNTGKSTAFYEAIAGAQKIGDLPVVIETEGNWNDEHARQVGVKYKEIVNPETGEVVYKPDNFIIIKNKDLYERYKNYCHKDNKYKSKSTRNQPVIEDVALFINEMLNKQANGELPMNLCFLWDSIGTLNSYRSATSNTQNNQWNAGAMNCFGSIVNYLIPSSRDIDSKYTNTLICVQKIWLDNENKVIKHKGGEFMFYNSRLIVHLGGVLSHGTKKLKAISLGQEFQYGIETQIKCEKNQVTDVVKDGRIASTIFGFVSPDELDKWKKENADFIRQKLKMSYDDEISFVEEEGVFESEDIG
jgi:hypothetical protein